MKAGIARVDITPPLGTPLAGSCTLRPARCVLDRLFAKALVLQQDGQKHAILAADLIGFNERMVDRLRRHARRRGIATLLCNASHTHAGPDVYGEFLLYTTRLPQEMRRRYQRQLERKLRDLLDRANRHLVPVELSHGTGRAGFGVNRRRKFKGEYHMMPNPRGFHDRTVNVFQFTRKNGRPLAILFSYACHPTTCYADGVSGDYPGVAQRRVEKRTGALALFVQGAGASIRPNVRHRHKPFFRRGTQADVDHYGGELAAEVLRIRRSRLQPLVPALAAEETTVQLPFERPPTEKELRQILAKSKPVELPYVWAKTMLRRLNAGRLAKALPMPMILLRLAPRHAILALAHEVCNDYVPLLQRLAGQTRLTVLGYTNACRGYIPTRKIRREGGYEGAWAKQGFGLPAPFRPAVEGIVVNAARRLLR